MFSQHIILLLFANLACSSFASCHALSQQCREKRDASLFQQRLDWDSFLEASVHRSDFKRHLRMSRHSFEKLLSYIRIPLEVDETMAAIRGGVILPELRLYCTIRYLAGGSYSDIFLYTGML